MAGVSTLDSGRYVSLSGDWAEEMRLRSAAAAAQIASTLEQPTDLCPADRATAVTP